MERLPGVKRAEVSLGRLGNDENRQVRYDLADRAFGAELWVEFTLDTTDGDRTTRVRGRLHIDPGFMGWLIPNRTLRERRERKLGRDLEDLRLHFEGQERSRPRL